jgi:hypothetical protein
MYLFIAYARNDVSSPVYSDLSSRMAIENEQWIGNCKESWSRDQLICEKAISLGPALNLCCRKRNDMFRFIAYSRHPHVIFLSIYILITHLSTFRSFKFSL